MAPRPFNRLITRLLAIHVLVITFLLVILWVSIDVLSAGYFAELMDKYHIATAASHAMFVEAAHRTMIWAGIGGLLLAGGLSFLLMRRLLRPLSRMVEVTQSISSGDYSARVDTRTGGEVGQLAAAFNRMADDLKQMDRLRRRLMVDLAHELRTPLTNMKGYLEALLDGVVAADQATFNMLQGETARLIDLTEDIMRLAKADAARRSLALVEMDLGRLVKNKLAAVGKRLAERKIAPPNVEASGPTTICADPVLMDQVVGNLLDNVCRYTPNGGTIAVRISPGAGMVSTEITNTSTGLDPEELPLLFERFYRAEKSRSREHGGAGIGLAIVKEIITAHGGRIEARLDGDLFCIRFTLPKRCD